MAQITAFIRCSCSNIYFHDDQSLHANSVICFLCVRCVIMGLWLWDFLVVWCIHTRRFYLYIWTRWFWVITLILFPRLSRFMLGGRVMDKYCMVCSVVAPLGFESAAFAWLSVLIYHCEMSLCRLVDNKTHSAKAFVTPPPVALLLAASLEVVFFASLCSVPLTNIASSYVQLHRMPRCFAHYLWYN